VTYLKLIANALWAGLYGTLIIALLVFFLNDELIGEGLGSREFASALARVGLVFTPAIALLFPTLFIFLRFFAARRLGIVWFSLKTIVWIGAATLGTLTAVYYANLRAFGPLLSPGARDALRILCGVMAGCWLLAVTAATLAQWRSKGRRTRHRIAAGCLLLVPIALGAIMAPLMPRPVRFGAAAEAMDLTRMEPAGRSLLIVGLDAASMDFILPFVSAGQLPAFEHLLKAGASARLNSLRPCVSRAAWTSLTTGMPPWSTGVKDRTLYTMGQAAGALSILPRGLGMTALIRVGYIRQLPLRPEGVGPPAVWDILQAMHVRSRVIGWPATRTTVRADDPRVTYRLEKILGPLAEESAASSAPLAGVLRSAIAADLSARQAVEEPDPDAGDGSGSRLVAVRLPGLGTVSRHFLRYHLAAEFGDVTPGEEALFGPVLARYYQFADELIADLEARHAELHGLDADTMVVSAYGIEPVSGWERLGRTLLGRDEDLDVSRPSGTWRTGPDGALLIQGPGVAAGARLEEADILDVLPTALYMLGLPMSDDLGGHLQRRLFTREHLESHPVEIVRGYGIGAAPRL
jgi:hypothetical protein